MGRGKIKGKKLRTTHQDEAGSGEEEKIPAQKKRGRPQKALKDEMIEDEAQKLKDEDSEDTSGKVMTSQDQDHVMKRQRNDQAKEKANVESPNEETEESNKVNGSPNEETEESSNKVNGFRQIGNRRKNKPRRAAEAVVECH